MNVSAVVGVGTLSVGSERLAKLSDGIPEQRVAVADVAAVGARTGAVFRRGRHFDRRIPVFPFLHFFMGVADRRRLQRLETYNLRKT